MTTDSSTVESRRLSIEEFERLPDDEQRKELVRGHVVCEPPAGFEHGRLGVRISSLLDSHVRANGLGVVVGAETGFVLFVEPPTVRAPDVAFVAEERLPADPEKFARLAPDLAIEIVSPSNTVPDILAKVKDYLAAGTPLVWIVEPRSRSVTVYRSHDDIRLLTDADEIDGGIVLPGFRVPVAELFDR